jgi:hypothetical protein
MDMSQGVFLVATGDRCRREAAEAVRFLARTNRGCPVTVFTDDRDAFAALGVQADVVVLERPQHSFGDKIAGFLSAPYERNVFLDTDAFAAGDLTDLFRLLDRFDLAAAHAPGRSGARFHAYESKALPPTFPQLNTGVVAFRRSPVATRTFERWHELFRSKEHAGDMHDQPTFRQAVYESGLSISVLPPEWNALGGSGYFSGPVEILHSHGLSAESAGDAVARLNATTGPRLVLPSGEILAYPTAAEPAPTPAPAAEVPAPAHTIVATPASVTYNVPTRADLPELLNRLGLRGSGVEVGVKEGKYSAAILARWHGRLLISVDPWSEAPAEEYVDKANVSQAQHETFLATTRARLAPFGDRSAIWRMRGDEAAAQIPDWSLDFVYIDARHDYSSVLEDLAVWFPKVAPGGVLAGHDYVDGHLPEGIFGVRAAVDEFFGARGMSVGVTTNEPATYPSWIVRIPASAAPAGRVSIAA